MDGTAVLEAHQPWQRVNRLFYENGYERSDVATLHRMGRARPRLVCFVLEDVGSGRIFWLKVEEGVNWRPVGSIILDTFFWIEKNTGLTQRLSTDSDEGFCRCVILKGMRCGAECEMVKMGAECAGSAHRDLDCGNKEVVKLKKSGNWPEVHLDIFPGMGLGLRATRGIREGLFVGPYFGRAKNMPKQRSRKGHHYLVEMDNGIILDAAREGSLMRYVNTSCDPNVRLVQRSIEGMDELFYVSMRVIAAGEDITTSYGDKTWNGVCRCGKLGCLGSIGNHSHE